LLIIRYRRHYLFAIRLLLGHSLKPQHTKIETPREIIVPKNPDFTDSAYRKTLRLLVAKFGTRALIRWTAEDLARHSAVSVTTVRRADLMPSATALTRANDQAIRRALEHAGVLFIDAEGGAAREYGCGPPQLIINFPMRAVPADARGWG
jgi:hypothetical protein